MIMNRRTWQRCVTGIESSLFKNDTVEIIGARWQRRLVRKNVFTYKDKIRYKKDLMFRK